MKFKWTVEIEVAEVWVADGFDCTDERVADLVHRFLGYSRDHEVKCKVLSRPPDEAVAKAMGYPATEVARYIKERGK